MANVTAGNPVAQIGSGYRLRAWLAMFLLVAFLALYLLLACWFTWTTWRMISGAFGGGRPFAGILSAIPALFLAVFMWKALLFVRVGGAAGNRTEITAADQPRLFEFIYQLADELGAPRPHKVFVSPVVNASVFYDLSILNFLFPSKKNLMIGLGLINSLDRSEFRAVLAHEFGHFAQKTMSVGKWIYIGSQIAEHIVSKRDWLDNGLDWLSAFDFRLAWIGWIMRIIVWSIRSITETVFGFVILAQRALSREMEFEADLVAVSATGSDALVHALDKLSVADEDWGQALQFADRLLDKKKLIPDPFAIQTAITDHLRTVMHQPNRGKTPPVPVSNASQHRIFTVEMAQPPKMWATHPPNNEREDNAKRNYVAAALDPTPAWSLFDNVEELKESVTAIMLEGVAESDTEVVSISVEESLQEVATFYARKKFDPAFKGAYIDRGVMTGFGSVEEILGVLPPREEIADQLRSAYPEELRGQLEHWRNLSEDVVLLQSIEKGVLDSPTGIIRHRGQDYKLSSLSTLIENVTQERNQTQASIDMQDRQSRSAHHAASRYLARGWQDYHGSLVKLLHYAEHSLAELNDARSFANNFYYMSVAGGRPSERRIKKLMSAMNEFHSVMRHLYADASKLKVPPTVLTRLEAKTWPEALGKFELPAANRENLSQWLSVIDSWYYSVWDRYQKLCDETLELLLDAEQKISQDYLANADPGVAPAALVAPVGYKTRLRGTERAKQEKLDWWSRFTLADGKGPAIFRFAVAASIVGGVIWLGTIAGNAKVMVCNGLVVPVKVQLNDKTIELEPMCHRSFSAGSARQGTVVTTTADGDEIESFDVDLGLAYATYVYNIGNGTSMTEWEMVYGNARANPPKDLGAPRWKTTGVTCLFEKPPRSVKTKSGGAKRSVLTHHAKLPPSQMMSLVDDENESTSMIRMHAMWDKSGTIWLDRWLGFASELDDFSDIIEHRISIDPQDTLANHVRLEMLEGQEKEDWKQHIRQLAIDDSENGDLKYFAINTEEPSDERDAMFKQGLEKFPQNRWFQFASGMIDFRSGKFAAANQQLASVVRVRGPWFGAAAMTCARIRRMMVEGEQPNYGGLDSAVDLQMFLAIENANTHAERSPFVAYKLLSDGKPVEALSRAKGSEVEPDIQVLVAVSEGAEPQWQELAFDIPVDEMNQRNKLYMASMSARLGKPAEKYLDSHRENDSSTRNSPADKLQEIIASKASKFSDDFLKGLNPEERGLVMAAAVTFDNQRTPDQWKLDAKRLLFCVERPWFSVKEGPQTD